MKRFHLFSLTTALVLGLVAGCATCKVPDESKARFVPLDPGVAQSVRLAGTEEKVTSDGRLEVVAKLQNLLNRRIEVQVDCVFKDEQGFPTNDEASFQTLILTENAVEAVRFSSLNNQARKYTIRVRQAR